MSDEYSLDWDDDFFSGDIGFDDNFDMDPYKNKGFFSAVGSGFLSRAVDSTIGSTDAQLRTARTFLPKSFSNFFDKVSYLNEKREELVQEFKENNYESVRSLQNIAKNISERMGDENSKLSKKLNDFSDKDFSSWENYSYGEDGESLARIGEVTQETIDRELVKLVDSQTESFNNIATGLNQMQSHIGGGTIAAIKSGNRELVGVQSSVRELLDYQRNVQYKMDKAKVELLTRTYLVNAKFYKFMEKAFHTSIKELKAITTNTGLSDYEKTSLMDRTKEGLTNSFFGVVGRRAGGLLGSLRNSFNKEGRLDKYQQGGQALSGIESILQLTEGVDLSKGMVGDAIGKMLAERLINDLPYILNQGPFANLFNDTLDKNPNLKKGYDKLKNAGNLASYNATSGGGLLNYYAQYWEDLDVNQFYDYDDYVEQTKAVGKKPMPKAAFIAMNGLGNQAKSTANRLMGRLDKSRGTQYVLQQKDSRALANVGQWKEINNVTLNDIIPGLLSRIYESIERMRTGNDTFQSPVYNFNRGQFVAKDTAKKLVENDLFKHSSFRNAAMNANNIVSQIDNSNILTADQRKQLALKIFQDADKEFGFNPYYYANGNEIEGLDSDSQEVVSKLIRSRFGIDDQKLSDYNKGNVKTKLKMASLGFSGEEAGTLNEIGALVETLKEALPNITDNLKANREIGNDQLLREMGIVYNKNGNEHFDMSKFWDRLASYIDNPNDPSLRGDFDVDTNGNIKSAGRTRSFGGGSSFKDNKAEVQENNYIPGESQKVFEDAVSKFTKGIDNLNETIGKVDFSRVQVDLGTIPDGIGSLQNILEKINKRDDKKLSVMEEIASCVCRQAGGWGSKSKTEKSKIVRDEKRSKESILEKLKELNPRGVFNKALETLVENQPLVLGGMIGGIGALAFHNPKAAALLTAGVGIATIYNGLGKLSRGEMPNDDEDIYDETGEVLLHASKLRMGDYYDAVSKQVIQSWKEIKGAVFDSVSQTYTTVAQLTARLFGPDGRALIITGLSKVKDALNYVWNKVDLAGRFGGVLDRTKALFYQQDVYVKGESNPRLTRKGFGSDRYYCYNPTTKKPFLIKGWNQIKGPVYELDQDGTLNQVVSEVELANGLVTSSGISLDKLKQATSWLGQNAFTTLGKVKDYGLEKAGVVKDKVAGMVLPSFRGVEGRLDSIYNLLCKQFNIDPSEFAYNGPSSGGGSGSTDPEKVARNFTSPIKDFYNNVKSRFTGKHEEIDPANAEYPNKIRLNSLADQKIKEAEKKKDRFYDDIHAIREDMDAAKAPGEKKESKGLFGKIGDILTSGIGSIVKFFTNPVGFVGGIAGAILTSMIRSPVRLVKLGSLLFKSVLGIASPVYKLLSWGFTGLLQLMRGRAIRGNLPGRGRGKGRRSSRARSRGGRFGRFGKIAGLTGLGIAGASYASSSFASDDVPDNMPDDVYNDTDYGYNGNEFADDAADVAGAGAEYGVSRLASTAPVRNAGTKAAEKIGMEGAGKLLGRGVGKFIPGVNLALGLYDGISGFNDRDQLSEVYNKDKFTGREKFANAATEVLGLGGLVSGGMNLLSDITGIEGLRQQGGMTRFIEKGLGLSEKVFSMLPVVGSTSTVLSFFDDDMEAAIKTPQRKIRIAMYGFNNIEAEIIQTISAAEKTLEKYVTFDSSNGIVSLDNKAPISDLLSTFGQSNPQEAAVWLKYRFLPVYKLWQSALRIVGFKSLEELDASKEPKVIKICNQLRGAVGSVSPYPFDVIANIDPETPMMAREQTEGVLNTLLKELRDSIGTGSNTAGADGIVPTNSFIRTDTEVREGKSKEDAGFFAKIKDYIKEAGVGLDDSIYSPSVEVVNIDISDLHKDQNTAIDELTLVRLAAYGNTDDESIKVDTVLRLERYCEKFFTYQGGTAKYTGNTGEIYSLFKNSFRVIPQWESNWINWFNKRFLPVLKVWFEQVFMLRNAPPARAWKSLSATNKFIISQALIDVKVKTDDKDTTSVWDITESPFPATKSGGDSSIAKVYISNLESRSAAAKLKTPDEEFAKSNPIDLSSSTKNLSFEEQQKVIARASGGISIGGENRLSNSGYDTGGYNNQSIGASASNTGMFSSENQGDISGGGTDYTPSATQTEKGFKISEQEAIKTILNEFVKAGITDNRILAFALANAKAETNFQGSAENLNYSADRLPGIFSSTFGRNPDLAYKFGRVGNKPADQKAIANIAYGKKYGNQGGEDGWDYRGRGYTQLTFKDNYKAIGDQIGDPSIVNNPEKLTKDPVAAAKSVVGFFKAHPELMDYVKNGKIAAAAGVVGRHAEGINKKVGFYPEFLKRLTQGDLKSILSSEENKESNDEDANLAPIPQLGPTSTPGDVSAEAAEKTNAPPAVEDISATTPDFNTVTQPDVAAPQASPDATSVPSNSTQAPQPKASDSAPAAAPPPVAKTPVRNTSSPQQPAPVTTELAFPDKTIKVQDDTVATAIAGLAEAISKAIGSGTVAGKRVGLGQRT